MPAPAPALFPAGYIRCGKHHVEGQDGYSFSDAQKHRKFAEWKAVRLFEKILMALSDGETRQSSPDMAGHSGAEKGEGRNAGRLPPERMDMQSKRRQTFPLKADRPFKTRKPAFVCCSEMLPQRITESPIQPFSESPASTAFAKRTAPVRLRCVSSRAPSG